MLVACRLAGLSALERHYAGINGPHATQRFLAEPSATPESIAPSPTVLCSTRRG
jgi:hypothetical protein